MTKKDLVWRLKERPTVHEITELVRDEVISKEEARDILFNENTTKSDSDKIKALEKQIEFLEDLVKDLSRSHHQVISTTYVDNWVKRYRPTLPYIVYASHNVPTGIGPKATLASYTQNLIG